MVRKWHVYEVSRCVGWIKESDSTSRVIVVSALFSPTSFVLDNSLVIVRNQQLLYDVKGDESSQAIDDITLVESDKENVMEEPNLLGGDEIVGGDGAIVPEVGFPVRTRNSNKDDDGVVRYITLTYSREGKRSNTTVGSLRPQATILIGCKARLTASADSHGVWKINTVNLKHNHRTSPTKSRMYCCNRELSAQVKRRLEVNDIVEIPLHKSYNSVVVEAGGYKKVSFVEKDCRNYVEQVQRLRLGKGDAITKKCVLGRRSRQAYKEFGDVVTFDTTYLTNKYDMPFTPFVGVNHHGQSTLLGCGLLSGEDINTFVWLFRTWLQCMHGQASHRIITDQDKAMQSTIEIVFPDTNHRWRLWHILKKLPKKFGYHVHKGSIFHTIHGLVYDSQFVEQFDDGWKAMIEKFELHDNDWLSGLYDNRCRWVPCYLKATFWAGMSTTQKSEGINAFFDGFVHVKTSLK
ncbi:protein FAR1-RELATED SEQUENCE 5-like [Olea europaea var. sylvestris]|uniref:protein FAR1-RELATED SEQUENCE 5-like n=1 Tax=Olea europaea var. sylvestris TaxID=158386 RepID=UPI000C1D2411|nr:protein FAR1-RELATED SEQUENCE 5-like [Olea europaea var. sylvestris]